MLLPGAYQVTTYGKERKICAAFCSKPKVPDYQSLLRIHLPAMPILYHIGKAGISLNFYIWGYEDEKEEVIDELKCAFAGLKDFYNEAAQVGQNVLVSIY